jgi:flagellar protein FlgJ
MASISLPSAIPSPAATAALASTKPNAASLRAGKAHEVAQDFEQVFLNSMFQQMFANVGQGPFSGGHGANIWRSFLTDEYSKSFVKAGGIGIADQVMRALLARQEVK